MAPANTRRRLAWVVAALVAATASVVVLEAIEVAPQSTAALAAEVIEMLAGGLAVGAIVLLLLARLRARDDRRAGHDRNRPP